MLPVRSRDARLALKGFWTSGKATMQGTASVALVSRPLTGRAFTGLGPTPLAGPIRAKAEIITFLEPAFCHLKTYRYYGVSLYPILGGAARVGWLSAMHYPVQKLC